jgi:CubicO group peptidase (beta-lactamase class C family)
MKLLVTYPINALVSLCALLLPVNDLVASGLPDAPPPLPKITAALAPFVEKQLIAGAVTLVESKERVLDFQTIGYADVARKTPMRTDTMFWIASMSKPITATALMMLVDEGKVNIDDPVSKILA